MENWATFLLVNVVLVVVLGVLTNLATPWVKSAFERSVFSSKKKRIEIIVKDFRILVGFRKDTSKLIIFILQFIMAVLMSIALLIIFVGAIVINTFIMPFSPSLYYEKFAYYFYIFALALSLAYITYLVASTYVVIRQVLNKEMFVKYKGEVVKKIIKLGGNPEDLDKEDG